MGKVIEFNQDIHDNNKDIQIIFNEIIKNIIKVLSDDRTQDEKLINDLNYFKNYISNMLNKVEERNWKSENRENNYIDYYYAYKKERYDLSNLNATYFLSLFTYCADVNSCLLDEDKEYVKIIVDALDKNLNTFYLNDTKTINRVIKDVTRPMIKNIVNRNSDPDYALYDMMDGLINNYDIFTVSSWYMSEEKEDINIDELTIDQIRNYFLDQEKYRYIEKSYDRDELDNITREHQINNMFLNAIHNINNFDDDYQKIYIDITKKILSKENIDDQIRDIVNLTKVYLMYGEQIVEFDKEDILHYIEIGGKKYENR